VYGSQWGVTTLRMAKNRGELQLCVWLKAAGSCNSPQAISGAIMHCNENQYKIAHISFNSRRIKETWNTK